MSVKFGWCKSTLFLLILLSVGCQATYYSVWEKMGKEKRHLLRDQVEKSRGDQEEASEEFKDALTRLKGMYGFDGGKLEKMYRQLSDDYATCAKRAESVDERIDKVQRIAKDLFKEWRQEIDQIQNPQFRTKSTQKLKATQSRFSRVEKALRKARKRMTPVLANLKDYVLYLKHNLNAQAVGSLKAEAADIEGDVDLLVRDISISINEADAFLKAFDE